MSSELKPARPDIDEAVGRSYAPKLPWLWLIVVVGGVGGLIAFYTMRQDGRKEALREEMLSLHETQLTELSERYLGFRRRLEGWIHDAAEGGAPETWVDPRLNISGLRSGEGLYARIPADWADTPERIEGAVIGSQPDAITRCMGIAPMNLRGVYEQGHFLTPEWVDQIREEEDMMQLRVFDDQLGRHIQVDAPVVISMMQADWFLFVIQRGENRAEHPVDVFLYDLHENRQLLRTRIQGRGFLVPVRLRFDGVAPAAPPEHAPAVQSGGAQDCSIASQIRALTEGEPVEFHSTQQLLDAAAHADEEPSTDAEPAAAEAEGENEGEPVGDDSPSAVAEGAPAD
ncbi:MAG: hypothetical protein AB7S26_31580 [Sandaracinaceae bacterium]